MESVTPESRLSISRLFFHRWRTRLNRKLKTNLHAKCKCETWNVHFRIYNLSLLKSAKILRVFPSQDLRALIQRFRSDGKQSSRRVNLLSCQEAGQTYQIGRRPVIAT